MNRLSLAVPGMSCTGCEQRIVAALGRLEGVGRVDADHRAATVMVDYDPTALGEEAIIQRLADAGYDTATTGAER